MCPRILKATRFVLILCQLVNAYNSDVELAQSESTLDPNGTLSLKWQVDYTFRKVQFTLQPSDEAPPYTWIALGFSDRGGLNNADVCVFRIDYDGQVYFQDMHTDINGYLKDEATQNCDKFYYDLETRSITFERNFDTCDEYDYVIEDGTVHVIWAHGADFLSTPEDLCLPCTESQHHGFIRVRLLTIPSTPSLGDSKELRVTAGGLRVPSKDTTYFCKVIIQPGFLSKKEHHITQFEGIVSPGNEGLVHHMKVIYCDVSLDEEIPLVEGDCFSPELVEAIAKCSRIKAAWAMGAPPFVYPDEAGLPIGGPAASKYLALEIHYDNPGLRSDLVDDSGIVVHLTENKRKYDAALLELGVVYSDKMAIPSGQPAFPWTGYCVPECSGTGLPAQGIEVFASQLHTHLTGRAVWTRHSRRGLELNVLNKDLHFSAHFQEIRLLQQRVRVLPGDTLETTCVYNTEGKKNATVGGNAISDEMCVNYLHYYPATQLEVCKTAVSDAALQDYFENGRRREGMPVDVTSSPRSNYMAISPWTNERAHNLNQLYSQAPLSVECTKSDGSQFQGNWEDVEIPKIDVPLPEQPRICPSTYDGFD